MTIPRRFLPSVSSLLALEAVDRLGSAVAAADALALTHSAVSRQLKVLEEQLNAKIFVRDGKKLALTPAGAAYARSIRGYLQDLSQASLHLKASGPEASINLATHPAFGMYWLGPKLKQYCAENPSVLINQYTRLKPFDFFQEQMDLAVHYGPQDWPNVHYRELSQDKVIPACAPEILRGASPSASMLLEMPLLHLETRPGAWEHWFAQHNIQASRLKGALFDQFSSMAHAASLGLGVALLPDFVAKHFFKLGTLVPAFPEYTPADGRYYLVWPQGSDLTGSIGQLIEMLSV